MKYPSYPFELEQWWLEKARQVTGIDDVSARLDSLEPEVRRLSDLFTTERAAGFGGYADDERLLLAYGLFFFPQNFVRTQFVLAELSARHGWPAPRPGESFRVLDLGCGLGAASYATLRDLAVADAPVRLRALDQSAVSVRWMRELFDALAPLWPRTHLDISAADICVGGPETEGGWDLVIASFAMNEAPELRDEARLREWVRGEIERLSPSGMLILIEPAGHETSVRMERLRDAVAADGLGRIAAPCLHHAPCPLLARGTDWCHEVRRWSIPETVQFLNRRIFRSVEDVKFSFLAVTRAAPPTIEPDDTLCRLVAPLFEPKGKIVTSGCAADGQVHEYEVLTRGLTRDEEKRVLSLERGDLVRAESPQPIGDRGVLRAQTLRAER
jgi:ribosomal protein RSM22 (predicted rRNA methylase)